MAKKIISLLIVFAIVFAGGYYTAIQLIPDSSEVNSGPTYATKPVTRGDLKVGVNITGQLNANWGGSVFAPKLEGITDNVKYVVEEVFAKENDEVKKDAPIMRLSVSNLPDLIASNNEKIEEKYKEINKQIAELGIKVNKNIKDISEVNPNDGIVLSSPISGRVSGLIAKEGEKISDFTIASIINDSKFKITFKATVNEFPTLQKGQKVLLNFSGYEGYYEGVIKEINPNKVPHSDKISYIHNGVIEAVNPGLVQTDTSVSISTDNNGTAGTTLTYAGKVDSYLDQSKITLNFFDSSKIYLATDVYVDENEYVEKGQAIVKIAGNDVKEDIQKDINNIKQMLDAVKELEKARTNLMEFSNKLLVTSPNDGIVSWQKYNVGDTFETSPTSTQWDFEIINLYNSNQMSVYTEVSDLDVNYVQQGAKVDVTVDALPGKVFEGTVDRMYQYNRDGKVVYQVNISVIGGDGLRPGMSTNCFIDAGQSLDTLLVPIEAVFEEDFKQKVEILKEDGTVEAIEIEIGLMNDRYVEALSGIEEGQLVVTGSSGDLMPSQSVDNNNSIIPGKNK